MNLEKDKNVLEFPLQINGIKYLFEACMQFLLAVQMKSGAVIISIYIKNWTFYTMC